LKQIGKIESARPRRRPAFVRLLAEILGFAIVPLSVALAGAAGDTPNALSATNYPSSRRSPLTGPTLDLDYRTGPEAGNPLVEFMYFVPLIAPEPVAISQSPGNSQRARVVSSTRRFTNRSFLVTYEYEFIGAGEQRNTLDHSEKIRAHEKEIKAGRSLDEQLESINIIGSGAISIEAEGTIVGSRTNVTEVRLCFNARGRQSPVTIGIHDLQFVDGHVVSRNEVVARVNSLTFKRQSGAPKMSLSIASVKPKDAGDGLWQNLVGKLKGGAVNFFIKPIVIREVGNKAMLDFGQALAAQAAAFTFPQAANLVPARNGLPTAGK
jgi:hypothetical protein